MASRMVTRDLRYIAECGMRIAEGVRASSRRLLQRAGFDKDSEEDSDKVCEEGAENQRFANLLERPLGVEMMRSFLGPPRSGLLMEG